MLQAKVVGGGPSVLFVVVVVFAKLCVCTASFCLSHLIYLVVSLTDHKQR